jgi:hypothetical protein
MSGVIRPDFEVVKEGRILNKITLTLIFSRWYQALATAKAGPIDHIWPVRWH